jgi:hypothetical protein
MFAFQPKGGAVFEGSTSLHHANIALLGQLCQTAAQVADNLFFAGADAVDFNVGLSVGHAPIVAEFIDFRNYPSHVKQSFRGYATAKQAGAAQSRFGFDDGHVEAFIGSQKRSRIPARTTTKNN